MCPASVAPLDRGYAADKGRKGQTISAAFPGNTAAEFEIARLAIDPPLAAGEAAQEQAEAQSESKVTKDRANSTTEAGPTSGRGSHNPKYALIHRSAWKGCSLKSTCRIPHKPGSWSREDGPKAKQPRGPGVYILWLWIKMRESG